MEAELGSALTGAAESVLGGEGDGGKPEEPAQPAAEPAPPAESAPPATPPAAAPPAEAGQYKLAPDGSSYLVPKAELPALTGMKQYAEKVQERFPTTNDAELGYLESSDFRAIRSDFLSGDDANLDAVLGYWAGRDSKDPQEQAQFRESFARMAARMPETLKNVNPDAYQKLGDSFVNSRIESAYARATETGDPEDLLAAQRLDWGHTGRYKTELPKHDPQAAAAAKIAADSKALEQRTAATLNRDWASFNKTSLEGPKWQAFNAEIDKALAPVKDSYDATVFNALRDHIGKALTAKMQEDYEWARNHGNDLNSLQAAYKQRWNQQKNADDLKPSIQTYTNDFMARVRRHLPSIAAPILSKAPAKQAGANPKAAPPANPQPPVERAANGQFQPQKGKFYDLNSDPDFTAAFKVQ